MFHRFKPLHMWRSLHVTNGVALRPGYPGGAGNREARCRTNFWWFRRLDSNQNKTQVQSLAGCQLPYAGPPLGRRGGQQACSLRYRAAHRRATRSLRRWASAATDVLLWSPLSL